MGRPSSGGHIRRFPRHSTSYRLISVTKDGQRRQVFEHRLVMERHLGRQLRADEVVHHKDGDGLNNVIDNLEVMTQAKHQNRHLMNTTGWDVAEARRLRDDGWTLARIADRYGVTWSTVRGVFTRRGISTADRRVRATSWDVNVAVAMLNDGAPTATVAKAMGVSSVAIRAALKHRQLWQRGRRNATS